MSNIAVAVDGPSASGKSTVSRKAAERLGFLYVDSGALYRAVTWQVLEHKQSPHDTAAVIDVLNKMAISFRIEDGAVVFDIDGYRPVAELRSEPVRNHVSPVAAIPEVRARITSWLRSMLSHGNLVMEGRDIGSAVFPETPYKFYLDADPEERARRRHAELAARKEQAGVEDVLNNLTTRDRIDSSRKTNPLKVVDGATVIDSTGLSVDDVVQLIVETIHPA
jgi:cytidylate kinase